MGNFYVYSSEMSAGKLRMRAVSFCFIGFSLGGVFINFLSIFVTYYKVYLAICMIFHTIPYFYVFILKKEQEQIEFIIKMKKLKKKE